MTAIKVFRDNNILIRYDEEHTTEGRYNVLGCEKEYWAAGKLKMDLEQTAEDCRSCEDKPCMKDCGRHLYIPGEIERIQKLLSGYGA